MKESFQNSIFPVLTMDTFGVGNQPIAPSLTLSDSSSNDGLGWVVLVR